LRPTAQSTVTIPASWPDRTLAAARRAVTDRTTLSEMAPDPRGASPAGTPAALTPTPPCPYHRLSPDRSGARWRPRPMHRRHHCWQTLAGGVCADMWLSVSFVRCATYNRHSGE